MLYYLVLVLPRVFAAAESFGERLRIETARNRIQTKLADGRLRPNLQYGARQLAHRVLTSFSQRHCSRPKLPLKIDVHHPGPASATQLSFRKLYGAAE
jgi:hypothetical protein